ncbi:MAG: OmpA family protein [Aureispira sp.]|nr:OmpA family protein [Aureispira sp.]
MYCSIFLLIFSSALSAQDYITTKTAPQKLRDSYKKAYSYTQGADLAKGRKELLKIIKKYPTFINAYLVLGETYRAENKLDKTVEYFEKAIEIAPDYDARIYYSIGKIAMIQEKYAEANDQFTKFLSYPKKSEELDKKAKKMLGDAKFRPTALANPVEFEPVNMGENINSERRDYFPSITADENVFVYTVQKGQGRSAQEDLHMSVQKDGKWQKSIPIPGINTNENEAAQSISADGKLLVFTVCNRPEDFGSCDLYFSIKINNKWTKPQNLGQPINSKGWESQPSVAPNGDAIYFTRGGARGQGHKDIYVSHLQKDGTWGSPINIKELNTPFNEGAPYIHPDGQTLYFSSNGHAGMGNFDLFISKKQVDGTWSTPKNLGYPINSPKAEEALAVQLDGKLAYIASDRDGGMGSLDIYQFTLPQDLRPDAATYAKARVIDAKTKKSLIASLEIVDLETGKPFVQSLTDRDGEFVVCLPIGKDYSLNVNKKSYLFHSENFALKESSNKDEPLLLLIELQRIEDKPTINTKPIILKNVFFATGSAKLKDISKTELNKLKELLEQQPKLKIQINGHTDNVGDDKDNLTLSNNRAIAVKTYLEEQGIAADRLTAKGFGEEKPIDSNETPKGRANNRRTEFVVVPQ